MRKPNDLRGRAANALLLGLSAVLLMGCTSAAVQSSSPGAALLAEPQKETQKETLPKVALTVAGQGTGLAVQFDAQDKWDWADGGFELTGETASPPQEGVVLTADLLVRSDAKPQFRGRMNIDATLYVGEDKRWAHAEKAVQVRAINFTEQVTRDGKSWYRATIEVPFANVLGTNVNGVWTGGIPYQEVVTQPVSGALVRVAGTQCDLQGTLRLENVSLGYTMGAGDGISVYSTVTRSDQTKIALSNDTLTLEDGSSAALPQVTLVDSQATAATVKTARYLAAVGQTDHIVFGHQDSTWRKAGTMATPLNGLTESDIEDMTGSAAGMLGLDGLSLAGAEFSAEQWNILYGQQEGQRIDVAALGEAAANVKAAACLTNRALERGMLATLSCHMPNFSQVKEREGYQPDKEPAYARYDFTSSTARTKGGDTMKNILPGGQYNAQFTAYLDMVADYASQVKGAVLFRPFHEGTGDWSWWGVNSCDAATYQSVFRYTVEYLRDTKQVHNLLYVYSPNDTENFLSEAGKRYPGDAYVDVIGLDAYQSDPSADNTEWFARLKSNLSELGQYASQHGKLLALSETGPNTSTPDPGDLVTGLPRTGCKDRKWYEELLESVSSLPVCYVLAWSNGEEMFHTPYVHSVGDDGRLYGHELLDDFLNFYNDRRSILANNQAGFVRGFQ